MKDTTKAKIDRLVDLARSLETARGYVADLERQIEELLGKNEPKSAKKEKTGPKRGPKRACKGRKKAKTGKEPQKKPGRVMVKPDKSGEAPVVHECCGSRGPRHRTGCEKATKGVTATVPESKKRELDEARAQDSADDLEWTEGIEKVWECTFCGKQHDSKPSECDCGESVFVQKGWDAAS